MSKIKTKNVKYALEKIGKKSGYSCKNEYRVKMMHSKKAFAYIDYVWMKEEPFQMEEIPIVAFEINVNPKYLGNTKKLKGDIKFIECHRLGPFFSRVADVGVVLDLMIHDIDIILGLIKGRVQEIDAVGVKILTRHEDIANARIKFKNGAICNITAKNVYLII